MVSQRKALVAAVRQELATARGTARALLAAAESARHAARQRHGLVDQAHTTCLAQLAEARDTAQIAILRRYQAAAAARSREIESSADGWPAAAPELVHPARLPRGGTITDEHVRLLPLAQLAPAGGHAPLSELARRRDEQLAAAEHAYTDSAGRATAELARATREAAASQRRAAAAATAVLDVDREAARLWDRLRRTRRLRARSLGELPEPSPLEASIEAADPRTQLTRVAERIDDSVRRPPRRALPRWMVALLPLVGVLSATATGLIAAGLVTLGRTGLPAGTVLRGLGWLAFVAAPSAGVPIAAQLARRVFAARLDIGGVGLALLGGMVAATALSLTFAAR